MTAGQVSVTGTGRLRFLRDGGLNNLIAATGAIGVGGAMVVTSFSLFLADEIKAAPLMIGLFFAGRALAEIALDLVVGALSDRMGNRRALLAVCSASCGAGALSYMLLRDYYLLFLAGAFFFGIGGAAFSQLFAYTREFAEARGIGVAFFNSALRAVTSVAWIVGPPLGFLLIAEHGFGVLYGAAAALYGLAALSCLFGLPNVATTRHGDAERDTERQSLRHSFAGINRRAAILIAVIVVMVTVNMMYQIDIALFVTKDLGFGIGFTGLLLGLASALEIPIVLYFGAKADRIGRSRLVLIAVLCAVAFFVLLPMADSRWQLLALQVPNAMWVAIILSIPVVILQDEMPGRVGVASALYSSAFKAGMFLGGAVAGTVAALVGFTNLFWVCAILAAASAALLVAGKPTEPSAAAPAEEADLSDDRGPVSPRSAGASG
ncbi:sugar efflux transporter [Rhizomonospora bruguierae]|uniref:sugar efflux transporter n=1 Tax=Rhizomonospora bruguierae TaxID=1581705 RepID=UPI001BD0DF06|nr:sugar efflux transporter [Micromonospora sp. NBRC 107566]